MVGLTKDVMRIGYWPNAELFINHVLEIYRHCLSLI